MEINLRGRLYNLAVRTNMRAEQHFDEGYLRIIGAYEELIQEYMAIKEEDMEAIRSHAADMVEALYIDNDIEKSEQL